MAGTLQLQEISHHQLGFHLHFSFVISWLGSHLLLSDPQMTTTILALVTAEIGDLNTYFGVDNS